MFDTWSYQDARKALDALVPDWVAHNLRFYDGDHWQRGEGWPGPHIADAGAGSEKETIMAEIERGFLSVNKIEEVTNRHRDAVAGKQIMFQVAPRRFRPQTEALTPGEQADIQLLESALTQWWDQRKLQQVVLHAVQQSLLAQRVVARLYVPPTAMVTATDGTPAVRRAPSLTTALRLLYPEVLPPTDALLYTDPVTRQQAMVHCTVDAETQERYAELMFWDEQDQAMVYRKLYEAADDQRSRTVRVPLNTDQLPVAELALERTLITEQVRQNQRALNLAQTMIPRTVVTAGFLERTMLNAQMPGTWEYNEAGEPVRFVPADFRLGAGTTLWATGITYKDAQGNQHVTTPDITYREPVDPDHAIKAANALYANILADTQQEHVLTNSMALMSGKSREQARAGFEKSVRHTKHATEAFTAELLMAALRMAEYFSNQTDRYSSRYRIVVTCHIDVGPAGAEERAQDAELVKQGGMAIETAMERAGIVDVDAELVRIQQLPSYLVQRWDRIFEAMGKAANAGLDLLTAAKLLKLTEEEQQLLAQAYQPPADDDSTTPPTV